MTVSLKRTKILKVLLAVAAIFLLQISPEASAAPQPITIYVNDQLVTAPQPPFIESGRTLVPFRAILEALGADVQWDSSSKTVIASKDEKLIKLQIGSKQVSLNGQGLKLEVPARIVKGSTFIPVRFVSENLGYTVFWYSGTRSIKITALTADPFKQNGMAFKINEIGNKPANLDSLLYERLKQETIKAVYTKISGNHVVSMDIGIADWGEDIVFMVTTEVSTSHKNVGQQGRILSYKVIYRQSGGNWYLYNIGDQ